jgi:F0F1-type ATP synthase membrane subunit b/b'
MKLTTNALLFVAMAMCALVQVTAPAHASGGKPPALSDLTFYWVNFVLYIGVMTFILRKPIKNGWAARTARIKQAVAQSTDEVESAERELNAIEALTKGLTAEQERVRQEIVSQAELESAEIVRNANQKSLRIKEQAKEMLRGETRSAESSFKASLVARALQLAKDRFKGGEFAARESIYLDAASRRSKHLVQ